MKRCIFLMMISSPLCGAFDLLNLHYALERMSGMMHETGEEELQPGHPIIEASRATSADVKKLLNDMSLVKNYDEWAKTQAERLKTLKAIGFDNEQALLQGKVLVNMTVS